MGTAPPRPAKRMRQRIRINKPWLLVVLVVIGQTATLSVALGWFDDPLAQMLRQEATTVRFAGAAGSVILILLSGLVTAAMAQRYENRLAAAKADLERLVERRSQSLMKTRDAVIFGLAKLAESRDDETGQHLERIQAYVTVLARELCGIYPQIDDDTVAMLALTSSLHDIGKVGIPDAVLLKPGSLDDRERAVIEKHPLIGGDCLLAIKRRSGEDDFLEIACEITLAHHERWDGSGYPFGLAGDEGGYDVRIEVDAAALLDDLPGLIVAHRLLVDPFGGQGVIHVRQGHDPGRQGNRIAHQAEGIAAAVPAFVMGQGDLAGDLQEIVLAQVVFDGQQAVAADERVFLDDGPFPVVETAGLEQHRIRNAHLADVVQR